jgi:hypothetical protein
MTCRRRTTTHHGLDAGRVQSIVVDDTGERRWVQTTFVRLSGVVVIIIIIAMCALPLELAGWTGLLASCIDLLWQRGPDAPSCIRATGPNTPSPIRSIFSLMWWPNATIGHIFLAVVAGRKSLPGAISCLDHGGVGLVFGVRFRFCASSRPGEYKIRSCEQGHMVQSCPPPPSITMACHP